MQRRESSAARKYLIRYGVSVGGFPVVKGVSLAIVKALSSGEKDIRELYRIVYASEKMGEVTEQDVSRLRVLIWQINHGKVREVPKGIKIVSEPTNQVHRNGTRVVYRLQKGDSE